jgi:O-methyltransferase involved in polyketide biosynthesis
MKRRASTSNVKFIPGNYVTDGMIELLIRSGFDPTLPTYFIWEGNTMYLPLDCTKQILDVTRFRLSFDYMAESVISKTTGDAGITRLVESFANMGAPWLSGIRDARILAREMGLHLIENVRTSELYRAYWSGRPMTSPIFDF